MALNIIRHKTGLAIIPVSVSTINAMGELEVLFSDGKLYYHDGTSKIAILGEANSTTVTNKNIDADQNTITNIHDSNIKAGAAINAAKIANGSVSSIEFQYLDGVTSSIQTQFSGKQTTTLTSAHILVGNGSNLAVDVAASGDLSLANTGAFTVLSVGASSSANLHSAELLANAATSSNTANAIVKRGASGEISVGNITSTGLTVKDTTFFIQNISDATKQIKFDTANVSTGVLTTISMPANSSSLTYSLPLTSTSEILVAENTTQSLKNKTLDDSTTLFANTSDSTKQFKFQASGITTATTRIFTVPNATTTLVGTDVTQTLSNKLLTLPETDVILLDEQGSSPSTPPSGKLKLYGKTDNQLYYKDPTGTENVLASSANQFAFFASSQVTTNSTPLSTTSFSTFSNSPAFTFTPTSTGTYKVYSAIPVTNSSTANAHAEVRIIKTSGAGTLLYESVGGVAASNASADVSDSLFTQSVYTLTASVSYVFDIQGRISASNMATRGDLAPFYMFAERCG